MIAPSEKAVWPHGLACFGRKLGGLGSGEPSSLGVATRRYNVPGRELSEESHMPWAFRAMGMDDDGDSD
jgi:hypothetical protein